MAVRSTHVHVSMLSDVLLIPLHRVCPEGPVVKAESALCYYYLPLMFLFGLSFQILRLSTLKKCAPYILPCDFAMPPVRVDRVCFRVSRFEQRTYRQANALNALP